MVFSVKHAFLIGIALLVLSDEIDKANSNDIVSSNNVGGLFSFLALYLLMFSYTA